MLKQVFNAKYARATEDENLWLRGRVEEEVRNCGVGSGPITEQWNRSEDKQKNLNLQHRARR